MYLVTSFSLVFLTETFGYYGLWLITLPITVGFIWAVNHFEKLENAKIEEKLDLVAA